MQRQACVRDCERLKRGQVRLPVLRQRLEL